MPIEYIAGDLFADPNRFVAIAHGCNCRGSMGAGIAVQFRKWYPAMYTEYRRRCLAKPRHFNPGDVFLWRESGPLPMVFNLATQDGYGRGDADLDAVRRCLLAMREIAETEGLPTIGIPRIGAGLGGLQWKDVRSVIDAIFAGWPGTLTVFEEFAPAKST